MKLSLGTVQFGLDYGISNKNGITLSDEVYKILVKAKEAGIDTLDTAPSYGVSEKVIGQAIKEIKNNGLDDSFNVISKISHFFEKQITDKSVEQVRAVLNNSLNIIGINSIYGYLFHNCDDLFLENIDIAIKYLYDLKEQGTVKKVGVSIYEGSQIENILEKFGDKLIDIVQLPVNVFDQRLIKSGMLYKLKEKNIEIHARSVFLQGLLLMPLENIDKKFAKNYDLIYNYQKYIENNSITLIEGALSFVKNIQEIDKILIGVNDCKQLETNIEAYNKDIKLNFGQFAAKDIFLIDPRKW